MTPNVPRNAYTDSPEKHPNLILGSLQLLFWLFFHPSAWQNHLKRNPALWKLRIQAFLVVPVLANSIVVALVIWLLGAPVEKIASGVVLGVVSGVVSGVLLTSLGFSSREGKELNVALGIASGILLGVVWGVASDLVWGVALDLLRVALDLLRVALDLLRGVQSVASDFFWGLVSDMRLRESLAIWDWRWWVSTRRWVFYAVFALGVWGSTMRGASLGKDEIKASDVVAGVVGVVVGVVVVVWGVVWGVVFVLRGVGLVVMVLCLPVVLYPFLTGWNILLYLLDILRTANKPSLLRWHSAFWDERQRLPLYGLDKHVLLVIERNPEEAKAAFNYLSTSHQRWAAQAVQIELDARELENCIDVTAISNAHLSIPISELNSPVKSILSSFSYISQDVDAALNQKSAYNQRLALAPVPEKLNSLIREFTRNSDEYSVRFRPIATHWSEIVTNYIQKLVQLGANKQTIKQPRLYPYMST